MEETKKNSKGLIVLVIILIICILGLSGYIVYDKMLNKPTPTTDNTKSSTTKLIFNNNINAISTITSRECIEDNMLNAIVNRDNEIYFILDNKQIKVVDIKVKQIESIKDPFTCDENKLLILSQNGELYYANRLFYAVKNITKDEIHISELENIELISENIDLISAVIDNEKGISVNIIDKDKEVKNIMLIDLQTP